MDQLVQAIQAGLETIDNPELVRLAALHVKVEDPWREERAIKRISPSLIAEECRLSRLKRYRKHAPQPGMKWSAVRQGRPSAGSNMHFFRGHYAEGMAVAALSRVAESYQQFDPITETQTKYEGSGLFPYHIMGLSPWMVFETDAPVSDGSTMREVSSGVFELSDQTAHFLAYPDVVMLSGGEVELVQMKCPSVWAFQRYKRDGNATIRRRYEPQAIAEMYIGRKMGLPIARNHILVFALEGSLPSSDEAKSGQEVLGLVETVEWNVQMEAYIEAIAREILEDDAAADRGVWPIAYPMDTKWPCDYCSYPRNQTAEGMITCEENSRWEMRTLPPPFLPGELARPTPSPPLPDPSSSEPLTPPPFHPDSAPSPPAFRPLPTLPPPFRKP